ncbi:MAG TPA: TIGR03067 domain-containing protein [Gemmata sp.]|jgi:uncharacterized protein (TIGR03067 family)|nr:TIGR03067 domain-containing protein [Gemmata sp.]
MKRFAVVGLAMLISFAGILSADEKDLKELEGTYSVALLKKGGKEAGKEDTQKTKFRFKGENLSIIIGGDEKSTQIKVDTSKQPHTIDITPSEGPDKGKTYLGIYKIEKGELTLAFVKVGDRPKEFTSENDVTLMKLKKDANK